MKTFTTFLLLLAIFVMFSSIGLFVKIKKKLEEYLAFSSMKVILFSNIYIVLLLFFAAAYIIYTVVWINMREYDTFSYLVLALLFFGSLFVGVSTLFLNQFVLSILDVKMNRTDSMTGLLTKEGIAIAANNILNHGQGEYAFIVLDLDNFKQINDKFGHGEGDTVIKEVAETLRETVREADQVGRFGGDEFVIILNNIRPELAQNIMIRIKNRIQNQLLLHNYGFETGISIGIVYLDGTTQISYEELFSRADAAMYQSKKKGGNCITEG